MDKLVFHRGNFHLSKSLLFVINCESFRLILQDEDRDSLSPLLFEVFYIAILIMLRFMGTLKRAEEVSAMWRFCDNFDPPRHVFFGTLRKLLRGRCWRSSDEGGNIPHLLSFRQSNKQTKEDEINKE